MNFMSTADADREIETVEVTEGDTQTNIANIYILFG